MTGTVRPHSELALLENVAVRRRERSILGPLSMTVRRGDFWGVVGPNGAGKTTLLRAIAGRQTASAGLLRVLGQTHPGRGWRARRSLRRAIGFLFQHHAFVPAVPFTVADVVYFGRASAVRIGLPYGARDHIAVRSALQSLGLTQMRDRLYRELSGGERQKVQFARLLAQEADLVLLDEPTAGLDPDWQERVTLLTESLHRDHGRTVVMVTHDVDRLPSCCNRVLLLRGGRAVGMGEPEEVLTSGMLSSLYGCPMEVVVRAGRRHAFAAGPDPEWELSNGVS